MDPGFETFTRAWCVAELVEAHKAGVTPLVCLVSSQCLDFDADDLSIYLKLATLTVED